MSRQRSGFLTLGVSFWVTARSQVSVGDLVDVKCEGVSYTGGVETPIRSRKSNLKKSKVKKWSKVGVSEQETYCRIEG